jgi:hypothetical protein
MRPLDREMPRGGELAGDLTAEEAWLLGEYRAPMQFWLPRGEDSVRMSRFKRDGEAAVGKTVNYE